MVTAPELLIVDDHPLFLDGLVAMTQRSRPRWALRTAASGAEAVGAIAERLPSAALIDVFLPDRDGFDLLHEVNKRWPALPLILISGRDHGAMAVRARASPALGFIPKTMAAPRFITMIEAVLGGRTAFAATVEGVGAVNSGAVPALTTRQAEILDLLAEGHGNKEIRHRLGIAERTVRAHLTDLFQILGVHGRMPAVIRARELGLIE